MHLYISAISVTLYQQIRQYNNHFYSVFMHILNILLIYPVKMHLTMKLYDHSFSRVSRVLWPA